MKTGKWQLIRAFFSRNPALLAAVLASGLLFNLTALFIPVAIGKFYEFLFNLHSKRLQLLERLGWLQDEGFSQFLLFFTALVVLRFVLEFTNRYLIGIAGERFVRDLREQLFAHQLQVVYPVYEEKGIGRYLLRFSGDLKSVYNYLTRGILRFVQDVLLLLIFWVLVAWLSLPFALVILAFGLLSAGILYWLNKKVYVYSQDRRNRRSGLLSFVSTRLRAILSVKVFNKYTPELKRYQKRSARLYRTGRQFQRITSLVYALIPAITYLLVALLMAVVYFYYLPGKGPMPDQTTFLVLILLSLSLLPAMRRVLRVSVVWKLGDISFTKLVRILELPAEGTSLPPEKTADLSSLRFANVSFGYQPEQPVFRHLDFALTFPGAYLFNGRPGAGKSTLLKLLLGVYRPQAGTIYYGEQPHTAMSESTIRRFFAVVSDSLPLYGSTVYEAIVYSRNAQRRKRATEMLDLLQQHEPASLHLALDDNIGDLGGNLTYGQQRLLMYARALLTNKPVLVLEKPLAGLRSKTSDLLLAELHRRSGDKMIIVLDSHDPGGFIWQAKYKLTKGKAEQQL